MELKYVKSESTVKPSEIEFTKNSVYLRRNISTRTSDDGIFFYTYEESWLTPEEFNEYSPRLVLSGQLNGDNNQLIIMEAIADLYETITNITLGGSDNG